MVVTSFGELHRRELMANVLARGRSQAGPFVRSIVVVVIAAAVALSGCGSSDGASQQAVSTVTTEPSPTSAATTSTTGATTSSSPATNHLTADAAMEPASYATQYFSPSLSFAVTEEGWVAGGETPDTVFLEFQADPQAPLWESKFVVMAALSKGWDDPYLSDSVRTSPEGQKHLIDVPDDVAGWLTGLGATVTEPQAIKVGTRDAVRFDVTWEDLPPEAKDTCPPGLPEGHNLCVTELSVDGGASLTSAPANGQVERWTVVTVDGKRVLLLEGGPRDSFADFSPSLDALITTVRFP